MRTRLNASTVLRSLTFVRSSVVVTPHGLLSLRWEIGTEIVEARISRRQLSIEIRELVPGFPNEQPPSEPVIDRAQIDEQQQDAADNQLAVPRKQCRLVG